MNPHLLSQLARSAKHDGLTLTWCLIHLSRLLEPVDSMGEGAHGSATLHDAIALDDQLDRKALALVLMAMIKAYPSGADVGSIETLF